MPAGALFVSHSSELNGSERMLLDFLRSIDRRAFTPLLVVPRPGPLQVEAEAAGLRTAVVPMKWWLTGPGREWKQPPAWLWNMRGVLRLRRLILSRGIAVVCSNSAAALGGALAARLAGKPHLWIVHEILSGRKPLLRFFLGNRLLVRIIRRLSVRVVVNSLAARRAFGPGGDIDVVYNGIRLPSGRPTPDPALKKLLGLKARDRVLGVIGKIAAEKGQAETVRAVDQARRRVKGLKVLFVGTTADGRYLSGLHETARRLGIEDAVLFAGYVRDVFSVLPLMTLLVSASRIESFGRTIIEAQAAGIPVLSVKTGGIPEIIRNGENGFLVESNSPQDLAGGISHFFSRKKSDIERVVRNARRTVTANFRLESQVRKLEAILKTALPENRRGG